MLAEEFNFAGSDYLRPSLSVEEQLYNLHTSVQEDGWPEVDKQLLQAGLKREDLNSVHAYYEVVVQTAKNNPQNAHWLSAQIETLAKAAHNCRELFRALTDATTFLIAHHPAPTNGIFYLYKKYNTPNANIHLRDVIAAVELADDDNPNQIHEVLSLANQYPQLGHAIFLLYTHIKDLAAYEGGILQCARDLVEAKLPADIPPILIRQICGLTHSRSSQRKYLLRLVELYKLCPAILENRTRWSADGYYRQVLPHNASAYKNINQGARYIAETINPHSIATASDAFHVLLILSSYPSFDDHFTTLKRLAETTILVDHAKYGDAFQRGIQYLDHLTDTFIRNPNSRDKAKGVLPGAQVLGDDIAALAQHPHPNAAARFYELLVYKGIERDIVLALLFPDSTSVLDTQQSWQAHLIHGYQRLYDHITADVIAIIAPWILREIHNKPYTELLELAVIPAPLIYRLALGCGPEVVGEYTLADAGIALEALISSNGVFNYDNLTTSYLYLEQTGRENPKLAALCQARQGKAINAFLACTKKDFRPAHASEIEVVRPDHIASEMETITALLLPVTPHTDRQKEEDAAALRAIYHIVQQNTPLAIAEYKKIHAQIVLLSKKYPELTIRLREHSDMITRAMFPAQLAPDISMKLVTTMLLQADDLLIQNLPQLLRHAVAVVDHEVIKKFCTLCDAIKLRYPALTQQIDHIVARAIAGQGIYYERLLQYGPERLPLAKSLLLGSEPSTALVAASLDQAQVEQAICHFLDPAPTRAITSYGEKLPRAALARVFDNPIALQHVTTPTARTVLHALVHTWPVQPGDTSPDMTNLAPALAHLVRERRSRPGFPVLGVKVHVPTKVNEEILHWAQAQLHLPDSTPFRTIHASSTLLLEPAQAIDLKTQLHWLKAIGVFDDSDLDFQVCIGGRLKQNIVYKNLEPHTAAVVGAGMLLATQGTPVYNENAWCTAEHDELTNGYIMAYDDGVKVYDLPYDIPTAHGRTDMLGRRHIDDLDLYQFLAGLALHYEHDLVFKDLFIRFAQGLHDILHQYRECSFTVDMGKKIYGKYKLSKALYAAPWIFESGVTPQTPNATTYEHWMMVNRFALARFEAEERKNLGITGKVRTLIRRLTEMAEQRIPEVIAQNPAEFDKLCLYCSN